MGVGSGQKRYVLFSCGHRDYITYYGRSDLYKKLKNAETKGLCSKCKREEFMRTSETIEIRYGDYKEFFQNRRNVVVGEYNRKTGTIKITASKKMIEDYQAKKARVYYDAEVIGTDKNENVIVAVFLKGNSYSLKEKLKELGFKWKNKRWEKEMVVFPCEYEKGKKYLPVEDNPEFVSAIRELEELGCIANYTALKL